MKLDRINWPVFWIGIVFWYSETRYFGWNALPRSDAEVIADGIAMLICALAFLDRRPQPQPAESK